MTKATTIIALVASLFFSSIEMLAFSRGGFEQRGMHMSKIMLCEAGIVLATTLLISIVCYIIGGKELLKTQIYKGRYTILIAFLLFFEVFRSGVGLLSYGFGDWSAAWYGMDYSLGFGSRLLVGSILKVLFPHFLTFENILNFVLVELLLIAILLLILFSKFINNTAESERTTVIYGILLYLLTYGNLSYVGQEASRFEMIGFLFLLAALLSFFVVRNVIVRTMLVTAFSCLMLLAHQGNFFLDYPAVIIITFMNAYDETKHRFEKIRVIPSVISMLFVCGLFAYLQFFGTKVIAMDQATLESYITQRTDVPYSSAALTYEYYSSVSQTYNTLNKGFLYNSYEAELPVIRLVLQGILLMPILVIWGNFWKTGWNYYAEALMKQGAGKIKRFLGNPILYVLLCFLLVVPEFILNVDWVRWIRVIFIVQFATIFSMIYMKKPWATEFVSRSKNLLSKHKVMAAFLLVYLGLIAGFVDRAGYEDSNRMIEYITQYILGIK